MEKNQETTGTKFKFIAAIMALFNLGDEGKFISFFSRLERDFNRSIEQLKINLSILKSTHDQRMTELRENLEDANQAVEDAWLNVNPEQIATNAMQEAYKTTYLEAIERAEEQAEIVESKIRDAEASYKASRDDIQKQIKAYEARIAKITSNK
jgi:sugar-specific transcriptional regulator TrmB